MEREERKETKKRVGIKRKKLTDANKRNLIYQNRKKYSCEAALKY